MGSTVAPAKVSPVLAVLLILNPYLIYHLLGIFGTKKIKASKVIPTRKCMSYMVQNITPIITNHVFILILAIKLQPEQLANELLSESRALLVMLVPINNVLCFLRFIQN